ncbi:MAG: CFI-box-CTERM domain-containing protein, partial [Thermodesulfobacteriota bacterium]
IYLDANPGLPGSITSLGTLAHEFQHLIHYHYDPLEETWVNEGLSGLARYVCGYGHQAIDSSQRRHIEAFAKYPNTSLTIWNDSLANYGATYLFMLYLAKHYGGPTITRNIVANSARGITGVSDALWQSGYPVSFNNLFRNWVIANYLNDSSIYDGIYGYDDNFAGISPAPGNMQVSQTHTSYPAAGRGSINPYAAEYINFAFLGGIYDIFVLVAHSPFGGAYAYSGNLGSLSLHIDGVSDQMRMSGIQQSTSRFSSIVLPDLYTENRISTSGSLLWDGTESGGGCFIATAVYGSPIAKEITILREFRDRFLLNNDLGRKIIDLYYRYSPSLARFISQNEKLRSTARLLMYPLIGISYGLIRYPLSMFISMIIFCGFLLRKICSRKKKKAIILQND